MTNYFQVAREYLARRRTAYVRTFNNPPGQEVLADLAKFCRASESTFLPDPRASDVLNGRREVWLRIQSHMNLTDDELWALLGQPRNAPKPNQE